MTHPAPEVGGDDEVRVAPEVCWAVALYNRMPASTISEGCAFAGPLCAGASIALVCTVTGLCVRSSYVPLRACVPQGQSNSMYSAHLASSAAQASAVAALYQVWCADDTQHLDA